MAQPTPTPTSGGILGGLMTGLLVLFVILCAVAAHYALRDAALPLRALRGELGQLSTRASASTLNWLKAKTLQITAPSGAAIERAGRRLPGLAPQLRKLAAILPLVTLRALLLLLALPLLALILLWGLLEGLWARDRIAATSGFPSALGFALGKGLLCGAALALVLYVALPAAIDIRHLAPSVAALLAAGCYLSGRNLPLHF